MTRRERAVVTPTSTLPEKVVIRYMRRHMIWTWLKEYCEAQWLKSHGWTRVRGGWLLPHWHPKLAGNTNYKSKMVIISAGPTSWVRAKMSLRPQDHLAKRGPIKEVGEPYDLHHAINSQRAHTELRTTVTMLPHPSQEAPAFPSYIRWRPFQLVVLTIGNLLGIAACILSPHWSCGALLLIAALFTGASCFIGWHARKEWELDWAESQLRRSDTQLNDARGN